MGVEGEPPDWRGNPHGRKRAVGADGPDQDHHGVNPAWWNQQQQLYNYCAITEIQKKIFLTVHVIRTLLSWQFSYVLSTYVRTYVCISM